MAIICSADEAAGMYSGDRYKSILPTGRAFFLIFKPPVGKTKTHSVLYYVFAGRSFLKATVDKLYVFVSAYLL
jgi:hypothetical protein